MKKTLSLLLALFLFLSGAAVPVFAEKDPIYDLTLDSQGVYLFNPETETALYEKAQDSRMFPASTTKIMTALVVLQNCKDPMTETVTVEDPSLFSYIIEDGGVHMELSRGETFTVYDLLTGLMVCSYCDVADLLAVHFCGSVEAFAEKMNETAKDLGLENSHFVNPHGLHHPDHYSSPRDIAKIMEKALEYDLFRQIISTRNYTIPATNQHGARNLRYTVSIYYDSSDYFLPCYVGGKSGFTNEAGRCLATYSEKDGISYISVLLGANMDTTKNYTGNMSWVETHALLSYAYQNFQLKTVLEKGMEVSKLPVTDSDTLLSVVAGEDIRILTRTGTEPSFVSEIPKSISVSQVKDEAVVGRAILYFNGEESTGSYPLVLSWDGKPIHTKSAVEKGAESAAKAISGIFREDKVFVTLVILLLLVIFICLPAFRISQHLHKKKSHKPKH